MGVFDQIIQQALDAKNRAVQAAQQAEQDRRARRQENDRYVTGGVHWDGYGLEPLIKMVAERANPAQLDALAGEWSRHGQSVARASEDLQRSLTSLMNFWSGTAADTAQQKVTTNAAWIAELGGTAQQMSGPIQDASGALRSAQDTMPGMPKNNWLASAGGGAAAGFMVGGPIGAAFGAALGGIASAFGFGSSKKKLKRKAVQTMQRYEGALLGIDGTTPQFGTPSDGVNPGTGPVGNPDDGIGTPGGSTPPPGAVDNGPRPGGPLPGPVHGADQNATDPSFAGSPEGRWQQITGLGPNASGGGLPPTTGPGGTGPGTIPGVIGGGPGRGPIGTGPIGGGRNGTGRSGTGRGGGAGRGMVPGGGIGGNRGGAGTGRGSGVGRGGVGAGAGRGVGTGRVASAAAAGRGGAGGTARGGG
ncbi:MAG TPA: WXG100 family type VII secretion target, partial [Actinophytocola sp.]|nr:WXG100 family type VII secretion target [Actinophytocola sp.]